MKSIFSYMWLVTSLLVVSCATHLTDDLENPVSDAWLDTAPRTPQPPSRPADGMNHLLMGLPPVGSVVRKPKDLRPVKTDHPEPAAAAPGQQDGSQVSSGYVRGYSTIHRDRYGGRDRSRRSKPQPRFVRTVEKVGPSIVPRLEVPETIRAAPITRTRYPGRHPNAGSDAGSGAGHGRGNQSGRHR